MSKPVAVGKIADFPEGRGRVVVVEGTRVAVFRVNGRFYALRDACPHMGAPLSEGKLTGGRVVCTWHDWSFDLETGLTERGRGCARVYRVEQRADQVYLSPPAEPRTDTEDEDNWVIFDPDRHLKK